MGRLNFIPVYEEAESAILDRMLDSVSDEWRKLPGDFIYDAVAPAPIEVKQLQANQDNILRNAFAQYAEDDALDKKLYEVGLTRNQATPNQRTLSIQAEAGVVIPAGYKASSIVLDDGGNPLEFKVDFFVTFAVAGIMNAAITCTQAGYSTNVPNGSKFLLLPPIPGIQAITDLGTTVVGADKETDESAWARYDFTVRNPDTGGNKNDYVRWAQEVDGVGKAKCIPRWNGNSTVKVLLVGDDFKPALTAVVAAAQEYLDPGSTGLGEGKAPCGAQVTATSADELKIDIAATVTYTVGADVPTVKSAVNNAVDAYLKSLVFADDAVVVWAVIGSILILTPGISNYAALTINEAAIDISVGSSDVATRGTVTI